MEAQVQAMDSSPARQSWRPYLAIALLSAAIAVAGFWPSYFGRMVALAPDAPWYIHIHAAVFSGWLALLIAQAWLAANGRLRLHRSVGQLVFGYGLLVLLVGWFTAFQVFENKVAAGDYAGAKAGLYVPFTDLLFFAPALLAAWLYRGRPEIHKRLIVVATTALLIAGAHRFIGSYVGRPPSVPLVLIVWLSPILLGMGFDWIRSRRIHAVYVVGVLMVLAMKFRPNLQGSVAWDAFASLLGRWLA